ncbi:MAG: ExbD/TolR family protein [Candidatus Gastranaerophilaceae bacterium]
MRDSFNEINITPLTDIFLVLLIIMMVIAPLLDQQGLNLTVPENVKAENIKESKTINFVVTNDNKFLLNGQEIAVDQLESVISEQSKTLTDGLLIQSDPESTHGAIVKLMDSARNAGVTNISVVGL